MKEPIVGCYLQPNKSKFQEAISDLIAKTQKALERADVSHELFLEAHNAYTRYSVLCITHITGHRPVNDPFCYRVSLGEGFAVVEDKAATDKHACRVVIVPPTAMRQFIHYEDHLRAVVARLVASRSMESISKAIELTLSGKGTQPLPWFFLLRGTRTVSITRSELNNGLENWPWPMNAGRHMITNGLRALGVSAELIALQLGHLLTEEQFCGTGSAWSLRAAENQLSPALETLARDSGWYALPGLQMSKQPRAPVRRQGTPVVHVHGILGPEQRQQERAQALDKDRKLVEDVIRMERGDSPLDETILDRMAERIRDWSSENPTRLSHRLRFLWEWAFEQRSSSTAFRLPNRVLVLLPPASPFVRNLPQVVDRAAHLRAQFANYLTEAGQENHKPSDIVRVAEIIVSAALFGGLVISERLAALINLLHNHTASIGTGIAVDAPGLGDKPAWRWLPDDYTAALMTRLRIKAAVNPGAVSHAIEELLKTMDPNLRNSKPLDFLAGTARAYWQHEMPGFCFATLSGETFIQPLPVTTLVRLLQKVPLALPETLESSDTEEEPTPIHVGRSGSRAQGFALEQGMRDLFTRLNNREARADDRSAMSLKRALRHELRKIMAQAGDSTPAVATLIAAWAVHLADLGTRWTKDLAFNTVTDYVEAISRPLIECGSDSDFLNLDDLQFEAIYTQVLNYREGDRRAFLASRLLEFHYFLVEYWGVETIDWRFLQSAAGLRNSKGVIDANLLTPSEHDFALKLLMTDPGVDARTRICTSALLILGYRFGPRVSDVLRLRFDDVEFDAKGCWAVIHIQTNIYGTSKSDAGIRQVPLVGTLNANECAVLVKLKAHFDEHIRPIDPRAGLFAHPEKPRAIIERQLLLARVHLAMRIASGDGSLHYQHLRHGFATRLTAALFGDLGPSQTCTRIISALWGELPDFCATRRYLTGKAEIGESTLQALPVLLGHAASETTVHHYVHIMDALTQGIATQALPHLTDFAWSYALGEPRDTVRKRLLRRRYSGTPRPPVSRRWPAPIPPLTAPVARGRPPRKLPGNPPMPVRLTLEIVDKILLTCALRDGKTAGLADRLLLTEGWITRVVEMARELQRTSGWNRRSVTDADDWIFPGSALGRLDPRILKETRRVRQGLREWQPRIDALDDKQIEELRGALEAWNASLLKDQEVLSFQQRSELKLFLRGLRLLGIPHQVLKVDIHNVSNDVDIEPLLAYFDDMGNNQVRLLRADGPETVEIKFVPGTTVFGYGSSLYRGFNSARIMLAAQKNSSGP